MKGHSYKTAGMAVLAMTVGMGTMAFRAQADQWDRKTTITVDQPIQITDTYLEPGTYVLKLHNSDSNRHIVQIFNRDENRILNTVMAIPNERLRPTGDSAFMFYETPPGAAKAMRAWFYPGDNMGQEFRYPKQLRQIAAVVRPESTPAPVSSFSQEPAAPQLLSRTPEPQPAPITREEPQQVPAPVVAQNTLPQRDEPVVAPQREEPVVIAQNNAPVAAAPAELPHTASPYPYIGLAGLFSICLFGLLRVSRMV